MARSAEDERAGRLLREIRHRAGITQRELAARAGVPRRDVILVEGGNGGSISLDRARATFEAAGARFRIAIWWGGAASARGFEHRRDRSAASGFSQKFLSRTARRPLATRTSGLSGIPYLWGDLAPERDEGVPNMDFRDEMVS